MAAKTATMSHCSGCVERRLVTGEAQETHEAKAPAQQGGMKPSAVTGQVWPVAGRSRLAGHAVAEVDDSRAEGAGLDEFEIHPALALGKERNATAHQPRVDPGPVLVDQAQRGRLGGESRAADRDVALRRLGSQPLDLLPPAAGGQPRGGLSRPAG